MNFYKFCDEIFLYLDIWKFVLGLGGGRALRTIKLWKNKELRRKSKRIEKKRDVTNKKGKRR